MKKTLTILGILTIGFACGMYFSFFQPADAAVQTASTTTHTSKKGIVLLPLGDGKTSTSPRVGYIYTCGSHVDQNGGGASKDGPWIIGNMWDPSKKISVTGSVIRKDAIFKITSSGQNRILIGNGLPLTYPTGIFPIGRNDPAHQYDANPNTISKQSLSAYIPKYPSVAKSPTCVGGGPIGYTLQGVAIFDGLDALGRDAVAHEIQDSCNGHPEKTGQYHYHSMSTCFKDTSKEGSHSSLIGYAIDGFGIYGTKDSSGKILTNSDLDECHGHTEKVMWNGKMVTMYHYHATAEYPYTIGCFKGTPAKTMKGQINQGQKTGPVQGQNTSIPQAPRDACVGKGEGDECSFIGRGGETIKDTCHTIDVGMVCGGPK